MKTTGLFAAVMAFTSIFSTGYAEIKAKSLHISESNVKLISNLNYDLLDSRFSYNIDKLMHDFVDAKTCMLVRLSEELSETEIAEELEIKPRTVAGDIISACGTNRDILRISASDLVVSVEASRYPENMIEEPEEGYRIVQTAGTLLANAEYTKLDMIFNFRLHQFLDGIMETEFDGFIRFRNDETRERARDLGVGLRTNAGDISTATITLRHIAIISNWDGVLYLELSRPLWPEPAVTIGN